MPEFVPVLTEKDIDETVTALARQISEDYRGRQLVLIGVLKGAFVFMADLMRKLTIPVLIDFIRVSSYGQQDVSSGEIHRITDLTMDIRNKDVLVVEDILDTGLTMQEIVSHLLSLNPRSVRVCALIDKSGRRRTDFQADYTGHSIEEGFLVGYGLDYAEQHRYLPAIYELKNNIDGEAR